MPSIRRLWPLALWVSLTAFAQTAEISRAPLSSENPSSRAGAAAHPGAVPAESVYPSAAPAGSASPAATVIPAVEANTLNATDQIGAPVAAGPSAPLTGAGSRESQAATEPPSSRDSVPLAPAKPAGSADGKSRPQEAVRRPVAASVPAAVRPAPVVAPADSGGAAPGPAASATGADDTGPPAFAAPGGSLRNAPIPLAPVGPAGADANLAPLRELLLTATDLEQAQQQREYLAHRRVSIISRRLLSGLGFVLSTYRVPEGMDMELLLREVQNAFPAAGVERNQRYQLLAADRHRYGQLLVGVATPSKCDAAVVIAMLDSGVNVTVPALAGADIRTFDSTGSSDVPFDHGTAIAGLLLSRDPAFPGLLPNGSLVAINVFARGPDGRAETRTDWLLRGLDRLAALAPRPLAVNLSFGGDYSALLAQVFSGLAGDLLFVAAAGNAGDDRPVYPAAYSGVHAVGALNISGKRARRSNYGPHVKLMAPGEDIWASGADGRGFYASGTSFAAPFATAALALARTAGMSVAAYVDSLGATRRVDFAGLCRQP